MRAAYSWAVADYGRGRGKWEFWNLLEPLDEGVKERSKDFLGFAVVESALLVTLDFISVPPNHKRVWEDALVVELLHQRVHVFLLGSVEFGEVEYHGLHEALNSNLTVRFDER